MRYPERLKRLMSRIALLSVLVIVGIGVNEPSRAQAAGFQPPSQKSRPVQTVAPHEQVNQAKGSDGKAKNKAKDKAKDKDSDNKSKKDSKGKSEKNDAALKVTTEDPKEKEHVGVSAEMSATSALEKQQALQTTLAGILGAISITNPIEYNILARVEMATLLWESDRERASGELKVACARVRELMAEEKDSRDTKSSKAEKRKFRMAIMRRIARLDPELIRDLIETKSNEDKSRIAIVPDWTDEAQSIMVSAMEEIELSPTTAARLAQESLSFGITSLVDFLLNLKQRDKQLAEQEAFIYLNKLRESQAPPMFLINFRRFIFKEDTPPELQEHFFESLAIRLRRSLRPDLSRNEYGDLVIAAKVARQIASNHPKWQNEFLQVTNEYEALMARSSLPVPTPPPTKTIRMNNVAESPGDTREISDAASQAEKVFDPKNRDKEYKRLATEAALKSDVQLAEKLMSQIKDDELRRITSVGVYSPLAKKALIEKDWLLAKNYALKITEPLGRSLAIDWIGKEMSSAKQDKQIIKEVYDAGLLKLGQESPSLNVAKGYIVLARSFLVNAPEDGFSAVDMAVSMLNRSEVASPFSEKTTSGIEVGAWVRRKTPLLDSDETLDLTEIMVPLFREMSKHDINRATQSANNLVHQGLSSLAQLGVARQILDEIKETKRVIERSKKAAQEK